MPFVGRVVVEHLAQLLAPAVQARHHGADRRAHNVSDLPVGEALDIGEVDRDPELLRQRLKGLVDVGVGQPLRGFGFRGLQAG